MGPHGKAPGAADAAPAAAGGAGGAPGGWGQGQGRGLGQGQRSTQGHGCGLKALYQSGSGASSSGSHAGRHYSSCSGPCGEEGRLRGPASLPPAAPSTCERGSPPPDLAQGPQDGGKLVDSRLLMAGSIAPAD